MCGLPSPAEPVPEHSDQATSVQLESSSGIQQDVFGKALDRNLGSQPGETSLKHAFDRHDAGAADEDVLLVGHEVDDLSLSVIVWLRSIPVGASPS